MTKSLVITTAFPPQIGGIQTILYKISQNLPSDEVEVLAPSMAGDEIFDNTCLFEVHRSKFLNNTLIGGVINILTTLFIHRYACISFKFLCASIPIIRRQKIKIIQCGHIQLGLTCFFIKKLFGIPYVIYTYAQEIMDAKIPKSDWRNRLIGKLVFKNADAIITISEFTKNGVLKWGVADKKVVKIPLGVDITNFNSNNDAKEVIDKFSVHEKKIILTVARLVERKGNDMVIKSLPKVIQQVPDVAYLIVGTGPMGKELRKMVKDLQMENYVIFVGDIPHEDTPKYYYACDVFIMPSRSLEEKGDVEGFGIVFLEANACSKPVIGGRSGGVPDAIIDGVTGLLVDPLSIDEISNALIKLLTDEKYAKELGADGRKRVEKEMNWQNSAKKVKMILQKIVEGD